MTEICVAGSSVSVAEAIVWSVLFVCIVGAFLAVPWWVRRCLR